MEKNTDKITGVYFLTQPACCFICAIIEILKFLVRKIFEEYQSTLVFTILIKIYILKIG